MQIRTLAPDQKTKNCSITDCGSKHFGLSFCYAHYRRFKLYGDPLGGQRCPRGAGLRFIRAHLNHCGDECLIWPFGRKDQYGEVTFNRTPMRASRAACILAHGPAPFKGAEAAHSCGNSLCVNPKHLRWATAKENSADKRLHGTILLGENCFGAKLNAAKVKAIRHLAGSLTQYQIADRFGVSQPAVSAAIAGRTWRHIQ